MDGDEDPNVSGEPARGVSIERLSMPLLRSIGLAIGTVLALLWLQGQGDKIVTKLESSQKESDAKNAASFKALETQVTTLTGKVDRIEDKIGQGFVSEAEFDAWVRIFNARIEAAQVTSVRPFIVPMLRE